MIFWVLASIAFGLAITSAIITAGNLPRFRRLPRVTGKASSVSVLIPARNEAGGIEVCVRSVLNNTGVDLECVVLDDHSTDDTAEIVRRIASDDPRVRLESAPPLPEGWCGKQHACMTLSTRARHDVLMWIDADVTLAPDALARATAFLDADESALISGFPKQRTGTWMERLVVPQILFVLLGYLPMTRMRRSKEPSLGAGCGQWFIARREAYETVGGHRAVRASLHDGVTLPRAFRRHGFMTDLFDATDTATCRMYRGASATWNGFAKNATEGMAGPVGIWVWSVLLLGGHVLPWVLLLAWPWWPTGAGWLVGAAALLNAWQSLTVMRRGEQGWTSGLLRPAGVCVMMAIQWYAFVRKRIGKPVGWRGRAYGASR